MGMGMEVGSGKGEENKDGVMGLTHAAVQRTCQRQRRRLSCFSCCLLLTFAI